MELLQNVGQHYVERKAYAAPDQIEQLIKKQFTRPRKQAPLKEKHGHVEAKPSSKGHGAELESVTLHPPAHKGSRSQSKKRESTSIKDQLEHFHFEHDASKHQHSESASVHSHAKHGSTSGSVVSNHSEHIAPSETASHRSKSERRASHMSASRSIHSHAAPPIILVEPEAVHGHKHSHAPSEILSHHSSAQKSEAGTVRGRSHESGNHLEPGSVAHLRRASSEAGHSKVSSHASSRARSEHRSHSPSEAGSRLTKHNLEAFVEHSAKSTASHGHSHAPSHHPSHSRKPESHASTIKPSKVGTSAHIVTADAHSLAPSLAKSHHTVHSSYPASHVSKAHEIVVVSPSRAASKASTHHSAHHSHVSHAKSAHEERHRSSSPGAESVADSIYPESSISQRSERSHHSHAPSHFSHASHHSHHHEPSHAASHAASHAGSRRASEASTLKGSRYDHESPDGRSRASSRTLRSHHSHHEAESDSSGDDIPSEHGGSAALLHQRQKYRRSASRGRAPELTPVEERPECFGEGFRPHRSPSGHGHDHNLIEVTHHDKANAPHVKEVRREKEFQLERGWWHHGRHVVAMGKEHNGKQIYRVC